MEENCIQDESCRKFFFSCGNLLHFSATSCPKCGAMQQGLHFGGHPAYFHGCGSPIHESATSCPKCGAMQNRQVRSGYERTTAVLLAIFLGGIGMHKFYLGKWGQGLVYLVFCWTFIPAIVGFVEGLIYLSMQDEDFSRKYT